ncbi:MAG: zinc-dependent metalloprotease family protein [Akkermansiaceae bacterium]
MPFTLNKAKLASIAGVALLLVIASALVVLKRFSSLPAEQAETSTAETEAPYCSHGDGCIHNQGDPNRAATRKPGKSFPAVRIERSVIEDSKSIAKSKPGERFRLNFGDNLVFEARVKVNKSFPGNQQSVNMRLLEREGSIYWLEKADGSIMGNIMLKDGDQNIIYEYHGRDGDLVIRQISQQEFICSWGDTDENIGMPTSEDPFTPAEKAAIVPLLNSLPGAEAVVYIDVDGEVVSGTRWVNGGTINAEPAGFDEARIREVWEEVAEDMRPFQINVTTDRAVYDAAPQNKKMMCIVTPTTDAAPGAGGVAYLNSFYDGSIDPCWAFNRSVGSCAMTISHEVGHTFGLRHDGLSSQPGQTEYHEGNGTWGPIMGAPFGLNVVSWSNGDYDGSTRTEDDLQIINDLSANFRDDQFGDSDEEAFDIAGEPGDEDVELEGVIETPDDVDVFTFMTNGGSVTLTVDPEGVAISESKFVTNMNVRIELYNEAGELLAENDPEDSYSASLTVQLETGNHTLHVTGTNSGDADATGFNDYGSIGQYTLTGNIPGLGGDGDLDPPTADLSNPGNGEVLDVSASNAQTYLEVTFSDAGQGVDPDTIDGDELSLSGSGVGTVVLDGTAVLVSGTTYRYGFTGSFVDGGVDVEFVAGSFADLASTTNFNTSETESFTVEVLPYFKIIDDADDSFTTTDGWSRYTGNTSFKGYNTDFSYAVAGTGSEKATWTFDGLEAGEYEIAITWQERDTFRATNAPYKAYDASNPTVFSSTTVDQTAAPVADYLRGGEPFQVIFPAVEVTSGTLIVELSDDANDFVIADAVRIELLGPDENPPVADLTNPSNGGTISPAILNARGYIEVTFSDSGDGVDESTIGGDEISLTGSGVNDVVLGPPTLVDGTTYQYGFTGEFVEGEVNVEFVADTFADLADTPNNNVSETESFTVATPPPPPAVQVMDDADDGFNAGEGWSTYAGNTVTNGYNTNFTYAKATGDGAALGTATWTFSGLVPGSYEVAMTWSEREIYRAPDAPLNIYDGTDPSPAFSKLVNQRLAPTADHVEGGEPFEIVSASVEITGDTLIVELSNNATDYVIADAVRIELLLPAGPDVTPPVADLTNPSDGGTISPAILNAQGYIEVSFSDSGDGVDGNTIGGGEISLSGSGVGTATLDGSAVLSDGNYRYGFTGDFVEGTVNVDFVAGSFADLAGNLNAIETETFTVSTQSFLQTIDDGDDGFTATNGWSVYPGNEVISGYNTNFAYTQAGAGAETATWTFSDVPVGNYEVAITWRERSIYRATNAPFNVYDGTTLVAGTVSVNQRVAPTADYLEGGEPFQIVFESVNITSGTLKVTLSNDADDYLIADAVRVELIGTDE